MRTFALLVAALIPISALNSSSVTDYVVNNPAIGTPGGDRFEQQIGLNYTLEILQTSSSVFFKLFLQQDETDRKNFDAIYLTIDSMNGVCASAYNVIYISSDYIGNFTGDVKREFTGIVYYMIARVLQWDGQGQAPIGLLTGIADFFRLKAGYATAMWAKSGQGVRWDEGYDVTARFLEYCDGEYGGIVSFLNSKMRFGYDVEFFKEYSGMSVDELWNGYVAKYRG